jgi:hypothetical protein
VSVVKRKQGRTWPMRASTRAFYREGKEVSGYSLLDWLHGYVYARWPYLYIGVGVGEHPLTRLLSPVVGLFTKIFWSEPPEGDADEHAGAAFADSYHGKVMPLESAKRLISVDQAIELRDLEQVIPYTQARDIVLQDPDHIVVLECPCRSARAEPCLPLDVCLIVGEPFASFIGTRPRARASRVLQGRDVGPLLCDLQLLLVLLRRDAGVAFRHGAEQYADASLVGVCQPGAG